MTAEAFAYLAFALALKSHVSLLFYAIVLIPHSSASSHSHSTSPPARPERESLPLTEGRLCDVSEIGMEVWRDGARGRRVRGWWRIRGADGGDCRVMPDDGNRVNDRPRLEVRGVQCMKPAVIATLLQSDPTRVGFTQPPLPSLHPVFSSQSIRVYIYMYVSSRTYI